jgi:alpha-amylase
MKMRIKHLKIVFNISLIIFLYLTACNSKLDQKIAEWPHGVYYEIFVQSFYDSDADGIGDFNGLTLKLDYIKDLGVNGIWLMPIMESPTYHKYDVTNYKSIHPDYGTEEDFKNFVSEAHKRDIKIIVDLILNHTGSDHPWFQSAKMGKDSPYRDYYVWAMKDSIREQIAKKKISLDSDNITQWHAVDGDSLQEHYYGFFWGGMPDLNFDNPKVKQEFIDIGNYWLKEMNVDGFRLDAAKHIFPDERAEDNHAFWVWFRTEMEKIKPDVYLVGEVWSAAEDVAPYLPGLPALFNFDLGYAITRTVNAGKDNENLITTYKSIIDFYQQSTQDYIDATFLKNHDQNRILSELDNNEAKARVAAAILLTLPGTPYLYYGEEIGMLGMKPDEYIREPFIWDLNGKDPGQPTWITPRYSTSNTVTPLSQQKADENSLYHFYKRLIELRNRSKALTYGNIETTNISAQEIISFKRKMGSEDLLVLHNISDTELTVFIDADIAKYKQVIYASNTDASLSKDEILLPAFSTLIVK